MKDFYPLVRETTMRDDAEVEAITQTSIFGDQVKFSSRNTYSSPTVHKVLC